MTNKIKNIGLATATLTFLLTAFAGCTKEDDPAAKFIGKWTSVSATGSVAFGSSALGTDVAKTIKENIASYDLTDVMTFEFEKEGVITYSNAFNRFYMETWKWQLGDVFINLYKPSNESESYHYQFNGDELIIHSFTASWWTDVDKIIGVALGEMETRARGYESMIEAGLQLTQGGLTVKFKKVKK